ncbi:hypothetical protein FGO68_gene15709 [Halteria grandinella]|uniref:TLDc domain-containing protein n=1 Tax=Halteria grandinella TaxID=5974 RepID=A0A8J8T027_HALGN|nr:hypothetical protein FGO68_gene15709 [Halteria grandinella]
MTKKYTNIINLMEELQILPEIEEHQPQHMLQFKLKKIKSKYIIAIILSYSDEMESLARFTHGCNIAFRSFLTNENNRMFMNIANFKWFTSQIKKSILINNEKDGFKASMFHQLCDDQGPTLSVIKSESGCIFGGYTEVSWKEAQIDDAKTDPMSFIFTLDHHYIHRPFPFRWGVTRNNKTLCWFGRGIKDLCIEDDCDKHETSRTDLGYNFYAGDKISFVLQSERDRGIQA